MNDLNSTVMLIINEKLFNSIESVTNLISNSIDIFAVMAGLYAVLMGYQLYKVKKISSEIKEEVMIEIDKKFNQESKVIEDAFNTKLNKHLKYNMKQYKNEAQKEEFIRNIMFKHLSELLAEEIQYNGTNNLKEVFNRYSERLYLVSQLTSNDEKEVRVVLRKLSTGEYDKLLRLQAVQEYLDILEHKVDMDLLAELFTVRRTILDNGWEVRLNRE
jgi:hypothetical protein